MDFGKLRNCNFWMSPDSNGRDGVSRPVERVWEMRRQRSPRFASAVRDS